MVCPQTNHYTVCPCDAQPQRDEDEEMSTSPGVSEFVSDAFDSTAIDQEDLKKEMEQLVLDKKDSLPSPDGNHPNTSPETTNHLSMYLPLSLTLFTAVIRVTSLFVSEAYEMH